MLKAEKSRSNEILKHENARKKVNLFPTIIGTDEWLMQERLLVHWSYVFLARTHRYELIPRIQKYAPSPASNNKPTEGANFSWTLHTQTMV